MFTTISSLLFCVLQKFYVFYVMKNIWEKRYTYVTKEKWEWRAKEEKIILHVQEMIIATIIPVPNFGGTW
jgi:hypothetical protein